MNNLYRLGPLFSNMLFSVPDYQRGYAWEQEQCRELLEDLAWLSPEKNHFMGTVILHPHSDQVRDFTSSQGHAFKTYDIIDGQQRLTTLVLYLHTIWQAMTDKPELSRLALGLSQTFIAIEDLNHQPQPKLTLNRDTHDYFFHVILNQSDRNPPPKIRSHRLLRKAQLFFRQHLADKQKELGQGFPNWLQQRYLLLTQQLEFITYQVNTDTDAGIIFETMNNRGKQITELEKVKNYLLYLASKLHLPTSHNLDKQINATWTNLYESLMAAGLGTSADENRLLRAHWLMAYNYDRREWDGSQSIKNRFSLRAYQDKHQQLLADLSTYLTSLNNAITAYCDIYSPRHPQAFSTLNLDSVTRNKLLTAADRLHRVGSLATFLPLLMATHAQESRNGQDYLQLVELCEKFAFRVYSWQGRRSNTGESRLFAIGYQLFNRQKKLGTAINDVRRAILRYCSDAQFRERFQSEDTNWYAWSGIKYFLYEYEYHLARQSGDTVKMPWEELVKATKKDTIEHILPQTIAGIPYWEERFTPEQHAQHLHDIGNLTLTLNNPSLSNAPFPKKRGTASRDKCYASSKLFTEQQLTRYHEWTPDSIRKRRQEIVRWAIDRWAINKVQSSHDARTSSVSSEDFYLLLNRRNLPQGQKKLYSALYHHPDGLTADRLVETTGRKSRHTLAGVLGALGHRVNNTPGYCKAHKPGINLVLDVNWREDQYHYRLRSAMRAVLAELKPDWLDICRPGNEDKT
jgi:hypothetical protein